MKYRGIKQTAALLLSAVLLCGCKGETKNASAAEESSDHLKIVTTVFPEYDWVKEILGDNPGGAELVLLQKNGADLHSFQASAADIAEIAECDVVIYVGGESDAWVNDVLTNNPSEKRIDIRLTEELGSSLKEEEEVGGMTAEEEENGPAYDEHVWLSLKNAEALCNVITEKLAEADPEHAEIYRSDNEAYQQKLNELDQAYSTAVSASERKTVLFADRFPFRYLTDDYGLTYYAAFPGCSAESEASFETVIFLAGKIDELSLPVILTIEGPQHTVAETVRNNTAGKDQKILTMNSMQSAGLKESEEGITYLTIMEENLSVLKEALGN